MQPGRPWYSFRCHDEFLSGAEIVRLDSNLTDVQAAIGGDHVVWHSSAEQVKIYDTKTWQSSRAGNSYNEDKAILLRRSS